MRSKAVPVFQARDGALLDLESLSALAEVPDRLLGALGASLAMGPGGLVLEGLELLADPAPGGPPGAVRPDPTAGGVRVSPGLAIVCSRSGRQSLVRVAEELFAPWPNQAGAAVRGALALATRVEPDAVGDLSVSRESWSVELGFVKTDAVEQPHLLPLAVAVGNGRDWATDHRRLWQPEHPAVRALLKRLEQLEHLIWRAEPEGAVWDRQVLGRNWVRYQTVAASALQASRIQLEVQALSTRQRVRLLTALRRQLLGSVERAAVELVQLIGPAEGAGPYRQVLDESGA